jgi:hypothetical protein
MLFEFSPTPTTGALILRDGICSSIAKSTGPARKLRDGSTNDFGTKSVAVGLAVGVAVGVTEDVTDGATGLNGVIVDDAVGSTVVGMIKDG